MDDTGAAPRTSTGKISDPDLKLQAIERLLLLTQRYITVVEVRAICIPLHWYTLKVAKSWYIVQAFSNHVGLPTVYTPYM